MVTQSVIVKILGLVLDCETWPCRGGKTRQLLACVLNLRDEMAFVKEIIGLFKFVFMPLLRGWRWLVLVLIFLSMQKTITVIRMTIPSKEEVLKINGRLIDVTKGYNKTTTFGVSVIDSHGINYKCNCEPSGKANCFSDIDNVNTKIIKDLAGNKVMVWLYPSNALLGSANVCYKISDNSHVYRSYEQSVFEYLRAKNSGFVYVFWFAFSGLLIFILVRIFAYIKVIRNGKSEY